MKKLSVSEWHRQFKEGHEDVRDDPRSGQPKTQKPYAKVDRVRTLVRSDRRLLFESGDMVIGICSEEETLILA
jgi:hypothetical protein